VVSLPGNSFDQAQADNKREREGEEDGPDVKGDARSGCMGSRHGGLLNKQLPCVTEHMEQIKRSDGREIRSSGSLATTTEQWHEVQGRELAEDHHAGASLHEFKSVAAVPRKALARNLRLSGRGWLREGRPQHRKGCTRP